MRVGIFADSVKLDRIPGIVMCPGIGGPFGHSVEHVRFLPLTACLVLSFYFLPSK